jgi:hypothetical protein
MKRTVALAGLALIAAPVLAGGSNLLLNPSFEQLLDPLLGGGFENWDRFGNIFADESVDIAAFDGIVSMKSYGGFFGPGVQSDQGAFQNVLIPDAAGKTYRASVWTYSSSADPLEPLNFGDPSGNWGHLPLLLLQFLDSGGGQLAQPEVRVFDPTVDPFDTWLYWETEGVAPAGTTQINVFCLFIQFGDNPGSLFWDLAALEEVTGPAGCNPADLAEPFGVLDLSDINAFATGFTAQDPIADLAPPQGVFDLSDINAFITAFIAGCP